RPQSGTDRAGPSVLEAMGAHSCGSFSRSPVDRDQVVNRRLLLRGGLIAGAGAGLAALSACSADRRLPGPSPSGTEQAGSGDGTIRHRVPDQVNPIPRSFTTPADEPGRLVELVYDTYEDRKSTRLNSSHVSI